MPLTLWTEHGTGYRSPAFFARIAEGLGRHSRGCCYVVPDAAQKRLAEKYCFHTGPELFFANAILTLSDWVGRLAPTDRPTLTVTARDRLIAQILPTLPLAYFQPQGSDGHPSRLLIQGIASALKGGLSAEELTALAHDYGQEREQDLARLYAAYLSELDRNAWVDPAQLPLLACTVLQGGSALATSRHIVEVGIAPPPVLWALLHTLSRHAPGIDLHVITPEMHRHTAEAVLGEAARGIRSEEWFATSPTPCRLSRAPNAGAQFRWMDAALQDVLEKNNGDEIALLAASPDPLPWLTHCAQTGLITEAPPLSLAAAPLSAPWSDPQVWLRAPRIAGLMEWAAWWQAQMAPPDRLHDWIQRIPDDVYAGRALRHLAQWEEVWRHLSASVAEATPISAAELRQMAYPLIHTSPPMEGDALPYTPITLETALGHRINTLFVLDATQDLLPLITPSPFFRRATLLPQDPNTARLRGSFPGTDDLLAQAIAAWQRLCGSASSVIAIFSATHDRLGEQFPSLLLAAEAQDITTRDPQDSPPSLPTASETLLVAADTTADVRRRMHDHIFSVSELEGFAACPFRHFARYILGIEVPDDDLPELPAHSEGDIIHRLLERYYQQRRGPQPAEAIRQFFAETLSRDIPTDRPLRQIQCERLLATATAAILWDQGERERWGERALAPMATEWKFGYGEVPALTLQDGSHAIRVRGKVDRIDSDADQKRLLLTDYKYRQRAVQSILGDLRSGLHLQVPLYILAAQAAFPGIDVLGGLLFDLKACTRQYGIARRSEAEFLGIRGSLKSLVKDEAWEELLDTAVRHAVAHARTIQDAGHPRLPHGCHSCNWTGLLPWEG